MTFALAPALTPAGVEASPSFFHGFATEPQVLARGLVALADITATRYFQYTPTTQRDPVLTAHGDRIRAEVFSACNGVYARLDLQAAAFDGGEIGRGATNVDIGAEMRGALSNLGRHALLHLDIGSDGLAASTLGETLVERPVAMPERWVRALGNVAELHRQLVHVWHADATATRRLLASIPSATGTVRSGWLSVSRGVIRVDGRPTPGAVYVSGLHRVSAVKRLLTHVRGLDVYGPPDGAIGSCAFVFELSSATLTIGLTEEAWRGHSGEGSLLEALAAPTVLDHADLISTILAFDPVIDVAVLARESALTPRAVLDALAVLAASGRVGWDAHHGSHFHRELPDDPSRIARDNPRLVRARRLIEEGAVRDLGGGEWRVGTDAAGYRVRRTVDGDHCACAWYLRHGEGRGPCAHVLAVRMRSEETE